ncbi:MAG: hypothetical protein KDK91_15965 [Gammaproteobacteria bacterium]|nr:hypothetical protein [Gammaproteobacteria bacterium]
MESISIAKRKCDFRFAPAVNDFHRRLQLRESGVRILGRDDNPLIEAFEQAIASSVALCRELCSYEMRWALRNYKDTGLLSDELGVWLEMAEAMTLDDYRQALQRRGEMRARLEALRPLADGLITLSCVGPAPPLDASVDSGEAAYAFKTGSPAFTAFTSATGAPAISLPLVAMQGLPVGVQLVGQPHDDWRLCGHARWMMGHIEPLRVLPRALSS